ncbi:MAG: OmpA family protein [Anaerolineae bacterium]
MPNSGALTGTAPAAVRAGQTTRVQITLSQTSRLARTFIVHFRFDKAFVEPCMRQVLQQVNAYALAHADEKLLIVGHCDKTGSGQYNQSLSERRARSVFAYLTVGRDAASRTAALAEWNAIRQRRPGGELPSVRDNWDVREYQHILQDLRFYAGRVDGQNGPTTRDAVRAYRCAKGLPPGDTVDDQTWEALIADYLGQDSFGIPADRFLPNCSGESLKWLGCGEEDPVDNRPTAWRPNRRVELLFIHADALPCQVPQPDTFNLPSSVAVNSNWCVGPTTGGGSHCCFVTPAAPGSTSSRSPDAFTRVPNETGTITVEGTIQREGAGGALTPVPNQPFVLIAPNGEFKAGEDAQGEGIPGRTDASGKFSFSNMPPGVYTFDVITPANAPILVRLADQSDGDIKGPSVCKALSVPATGGGNPRLDVVIVNAPVQREIRLSVAAHVMVPLDSRSNDVRQCPDSTGTPVPQVTQHTEAEIRQFFEQANTIWRQARVRFELVDLVREAYTHPIADPALRGSCPVDQNEFTFLLSRCPYPDVVNTYFFRDFAGSGEAGFGVSVENGAASGLPGGAAVADRASGTFGGVPIDVTLDAQQSVEVLAHELGHYLNLEHVDDTPANADRLMLPTTTAGTNRSLIQAEIDRARGSQGAASSCVPLRLRVNGATQIGGSLSNQFIVIQDPARTVTIDADIPDRLVDPAVGTLTVTGGTPGANPRQQTVSGANTGDFTIEATYTPAGGGTPVVKRVTIRVATFTLRVEGATQSGGPAGTVFFATADPTASVTVVADISSVPFCVPTTLVTWSGGTEAANPLRRTVPRTVAPPVVVTATVAGVTRTVTINVVAIEVTETAVAAAPALTFVRFGLWDNAYDAAENIKNNAADADNFVGADRRKFHIRVRDLSAAGPVQANWKTLKADQTDDDAPASQALTLTETAAGSKIFVSKAVMLATDDTDRDFPTHSGFTAPAPDAGLRNAGQSNHRTRRARLDGFVRVEYSPAAGVRLPVTIPVFNRALPFATTDSTDNVAAGARTLTPAVMSGVVGGVPFSIKVGSVLTIDTGANQEVVNVTAVTATTFTAVFAKAHNGTATPFAISGTTDERRRLNCRVIRYTGAGIAGYVEATPAYIASQFEHANLRWNQIGLQIAQVANADRPVPPAALNAAAKFPFVHPGGAQEVVVLRDLLPITPDNTLTVVFVPLSGANAYAAILAVPPIPVVGGPPLTMGDRFFIFVDTALDLRDETLPHELAHVLFNRGDIATARRFFSLNTNPALNLVIGTGIALPDVRIYRRIQTLHSADPNNDPNNNNILNWARRRRTGRFPVDGSAGPATATTGNTLTVDF